MLAASSNSPRPRPPAKARRSATFQLPRNRDATPSPPPYQPGNFPCAPSLPTLLGSPISVTSQLLRNAADSPPKKHELWMNEKSREELNDLLLRAESVINDRETDLGRTSAVCKSLFQSNTVLKTRHEALVSRLPSSPPPRPGSPSTPSHSRTSSQRAATWSPMEPVPPRRPKHIRHVSASASDLALLADQNDELLLKLQHLETEAARAELAGRRQLRALERELRGLQDELDRTRERSARLEEQARTGTGEPPPPGVEGEMLKLWKKLDREAKVRALRAKTRPWEQEQEIDHAPRDFAPVSLDTSPRRDPRAPDCAIDVLLPYSPTASPSVKAHPHTTPIDVPENPQSSTANLIYNLARSGTISNAREFALVSQLLLKIRELEEANDRIAAQHEETRERLEQAEREANDVKLAFESIGQEAGVMQPNIFVDAADPDAAGPDTGHAMRFPSFGKLDTVNLDDDVFGEGIAAQMCSTMRHVNSPDADADFVQMLNRTSHGNKTRGSLHGLFEPQPPGWAGPASPSRRRRTSARSRTGQQLPAVVFSSPSGDGDGASMDYTPPSPDAPALGFMVGTHLRACSGGMASDAAITIPSPRGGAQTLGSELGDALFDAGSVGYLRSASLCEYLGAAGTNVDADACASEGEDAVLLNEVLVLPERVVDDAFTTAPSTLAMPTFSLPVASPDETVWNTSAKGNGKRNTALSVLMEVWLWLQFAVIITVFVYAMARRGPKHVLKHASTSKPKTH